MSRRFSFFVFFYYISLPLSQPMDEKSILNKIERKYRFGHKNWAYRPRVWSILLHGCWVFVAVVVFFYSKLSHIIIKSPPIYYIILFSTGRQNSIPFKMEYTICRWFDIVYFICIVKKIGFTLHKIEWGFFKVFLRLKLKRKKLWTADRLCSIQSIWDWIYRSTWFLGLFPVCVANLKIDRIIFVLFLSCSFVIFFYFDGKI